jgi:histidinol dehydrogenase
MLKIRKTLPEHYVKPVSLNRVLPAVRKIIADVRRNGDRAVFKYAKRFDSIELKRLELSPAEIKSAVRQVKPQVRGLLRAAAAKVRDFSHRQLARLGKLAYSKDGIKLEQKAIPVERAGIYVPGGRYPLASTAIMGAVPATVAGVKEVLVCTPNARPLTIAAAKIAGAHRIFNMGGAQAIAAMALGTKSIPRVDIIAGPGNLYVAAAKKELFGEVGIDFIAGPTELTIVADSSAPPDFAAADILAQAEHDPDASILVMTDSQKWADKLNSEIKTQLTDLPTAKTVRTALKNNAILLLKKITDAVLYVNKVAPEHCQLMVRKPRKLAKKIVNCGTLLLGPYSSCALSDYSTGANHILPTALAGRYTGGLSVLNFLKFVTVQEVTARGAPAAAAMAAELAQLEGLDAHRRAAELRLQIPFYHRDTEATQRTAERKELQKKKKKRK